MLLELAESGLTLDLLASVCRQLADHLPHTADPDAALAAFQRLSARRPQPAGACRALRSSTRPPCPALDQSVAWRSMDGAARP